MDSTGEIVHATSGTVDATSRNATTTGRNADSTCASALSFEPLHASDQRLSWLLPSDTLANASRTRAVLDAFDLRAKYRFGQNFLVNQAIIDKIIQLSQLTAADYVLEVGPGIGTLTRALLQHAHQVCSIESDAQLPRVLHETLAPWLDHWTLIQADALDVNALPPAPDAHRLRCCEHVSAPYSEVHSEAHFDTFPLHSAVNSAAKSDTLLDALDVNALPPAPDALPTKLISNLPYAVAATIVLDYFTRFPSLRSATVMVQKEVAQRMCAQPGTKAYGAYTVKLSLLARPVGMFSVAPSNFFPAPHVESTVIRLDRLSAGDAPYQPCELPAITRAIEAAFANRRKTILNSMRTFFTGSCVGTGMRGAETGTRDAATGTRDAESGMGTATETPARGMGAGSLAASGNDARATLTDRLVDALHVAGIAPDVRGETLSREQFITLGKALLSCGIV